MTAGNDDIGPTDAEVEMGAAVDDALTDELKRQRARFVQAIMGVDRIEGVGRSDARWDDDLYRDLGAAKPDEPGEPAG